MTRTAALVALSATLAVVLTVRMVTASAPGAASAALDQSRPFAGSWSATGHREILATGERRDAAIVHLSGAIVLAQGAAASRGYLAEVIGFDDGQVAIGRAVWTDARGNRVFSVLHGERIETGRRVFGTFTGGTGPYRGAGGEYALTWQYLIEGEEGVIQGRAVDLKGELRVPEVSP